MATTHPPQAAPVAAPAAASPAPIEEEATWDVIENNYFTSMQRHREHEDEELEAGFKAASDAHKVALIDNYDKQCELVRRMRELRDEYDARQAELTRLEQDTQAERDARRVERAREDVERRAWFRTFRRGGLAYQTGGGGEGQQFRSEERLEEREETSQAGLKAAAAAVVAAENGHADMEEPATRSAPAPILAPAPETAEPRDHGIANGTRHDLLQVTEGVVLDAGQAVNGHRHHELGSAREDSRVDGAAQAVNGRHDAEHEQEEPIDPEHHMHDAEQPVDGPAEPALLSEPVTEEDIEMLDAEPLANKQERGRSAVETTALTGGEPRDTLVIQDSDMRGVDASVVGEHEDTSQLPAAADAAHEEVLEETAVEEPTPRSFGAPIEKEDTEAQPAERTTQESGEPANGPSQVETPAVEHEMTNALSPIDDDDRIDNAEAIGGHELPLDVATNRKPTAEPTGSDEQASISPSTGQEADKSETIQETVQTKEAELPGDNAPLEGRPVAEDIEMSASPSLTVNKEDRTEPAQLGTPAAPAIPASPSSSSDLSSRHTTPELDYPVSLPQDPSQPSSPEEVSSGVIEVVDGSGGLIGRVKSVDIDNHLVDRLAERPVQRQVQIRLGRKFTTDDLEAVPLPQNSDARAFKYLSLYVQATGELQEQPCVDCATGRGLYEECVIVDDPEFTRCGNCEWNKRRCQGAAPQLESSSRRHSLPTGSTTRSPTKPRASGGGFTPVNSTPSRDLGDIEVEGRRAKEVSAGGAKKGARKSLPAARKAPRPSTPLNASFHADEEAGEEDTQLPEITKEVLSLRDDGIVFTDPPMVRGVPLEKISPDHPYWEPDWVPIDKLIEPTLQKHKNKYEQLDKSGSTHRDKHLANRDVKRGLTVLKFLEEGELHPYQLVAKEFITPKLTHYDTLFRLAQLLLEELPKMNLDIKPSEWLRHRIHEMSLEKGDKFNVAVWLEKAYHDRKLEQLRKKNGFARVGRPPAHATKKADADTGSPAKKTAPRSLKRKDPHATPEATPSKTKPTAAAGSGATASAAAAGTPQGHKEHKAKKIRVITSQSQSAAQPEQPASASLSTARPSSSSSHRKPRIILNNPAGGPSNHHHDGNQPPAADSPLAYDGYTSTDSISKDKLHPIDWRLHQVKTRTFASNTGVTQYWHWVDHEDPDLIEHQVLRSVKPVKWSVFKDPYNFHLKLSGIRQVLFAKGNKRIAVVHEPGCDGKDSGPRGDVMAQFKRDRTKRRFLAFLEERGVEVVETASDYIDVKWTSLRPETLAAGDSN